MKTVQDFINYYKNKKVVINGMVVVYITNVYDIDESYLLEYKIVTHDSKENINVIQFRCINTIEEVLDNEEQNSTLN